MYLNLNESTVQLLIETFADKLDSAQADLADARFDAATLRDTAARLEGRVEDLEDSLSSYREERIDRAIAEYDLARLDGYDYIRAIKTFREETGAGLVVAKETIDEAVADGHLRLRGGVIPRGAQEIIDRRLQVMSDEAEQADDGLCHAIEAGRGECRESADHWKHDREQHLPGCSGDANCLGHEFRTGVPFRVPA